MLGSSMAAVYLQRPERRSKFCSSTSQPLPSEGVPACVFVCGAGPGPGGGGGGGQHRKDGL